MHGPARHPFRPAMPDPAASTAPHPTAAPVAAPPVRPTPPLDWPRYLPYLGLHGACLAVFWVGWSPVALGVAALTFATRTFGLTAFYHRYFSHRAFRTSRVVQFLGALLGSAAAQRGPVWWAAHHRWHHAHSDDPTDPHSPAVHGFWHAHMGWFFTRESYSINRRLVKDWVRFPELVALDRFNWAAPVALCGALYALGEGLRSAAPTLGTGPWQLVVWGFIVSTVALYHNTYFINSLAHTVGRRRFATRDDSRNNWLLALPTFGEGWHNNHHRYPASARQGFYWWEVDITYYLLVAMSWVGLVWDLKPVPLHVLEEGLQQAPLPPPPRGAR